MKTWWSCKLANWHSATSALAVAAVLLAAPTAQAAAPEWLRAAARMSLPSYPSDTEAVVLLDEQITTVTDRGEIRTLYRRAVKILRPGGRSHARVIVPFDREMRLASLRGWSLPPQGKEMEVKEKDAVETSYSPGTLYDDTRYKILVIPGAEPGNVIGFEYEQRRRPFVLQDIWLFQEEVPVRRSRFVLRLPRGWEFEHWWNNHDERTPRSGASGEWIWEIEDVPLVKREPAMPHWRAVAAWMGVNYFPSREELGGKTHADWEDVARWYSGLVAGRTAPTAEIRERVAQLTADATSLLDKLRALAAFAQRDVRYVAIEIGIGGYQPSPAAEVFRYRYGDCKDKVTLMASMLAEIGVESYFVLIHTNRGVVSPDFASPLSFNHAIIAIRLPEDFDAGELRATQPHSRLGRLLFFDPTDSLTPLGLLPSALQANHGLLVAGGTGELVRLPLLPAESNQLTRFARLQLHPSGALSGEIREIRTGESAASRRSQLLEAQGHERTKVFEAFLSNFFDGAVLTGADVENLEQYEEQLVLTYGFQVNSYARRAGNLMMVRPRVLGRKSIDLLEREDRIFPVEIGAASLESDTFEILLPPGYQVDELPAPAEVDVGFARYSSRVEVEGNLLRYRRTYQFNDVRVLPEQLADLKRFYRTVAHDERANAVLRLGIP